MVDPPEEATLIGTHRFWIESDNLALRAGTYARAEVEVPHVPHDSHE